MINTTLKIVQNATRSSENHVHCTIHKKQCLIVGPKYRRPGKEARHIGLGIFTITNIYILGVSAPY